MDTKKSKADEINASFDLHIQQGHQSKGVHPSPRPVVLHLLSSRSERRPLPGVGEKLILVDSTACTQVPLVCALCTSFLLDFAIIRQGTVRFIKYISSRWAGEWQSRCNSGHQRLNNLPTPADRKEIEGKQIKQTSNTSEGVNTDYSTCTFNCSYFTSFSHLRCPPSPARAPGSKRRWARCICSYTSPPKTAGKMRGNDAHTAEAGRRRSWHCRCR